MFGILPNEKDTVAEDASKIACMLVKLILLNRAMFWLVFRKLDSMQAYAESWIESL